MSIEEDIGILNLFQEAWKDGSTDELEYVHVALGFGKAKAFGYFKREGERGGDDSMWIGKFDIRRKRPDCVVGIFFTVSRVKATSNGNKAR